jgi:Superinfection immunity protein
MSKGKVAIIAVAAFVAVDALAIITGNGDRIGVAVFMLALIAAYWAPTVIAAQRGISNSGSVAIVNLFLGWTFIGWVVALAMAVAGKRPSAQRPRSRCFRSARLGESGNQRKTPYERLRQKTQTPAVPMNVSHTLSARPRF